MNRKQPTGPEVDLDGIEAYVNAATPGPWKGDPEPYAIYIYGADGSPVADTHVPGKYNRGGVDFPKPSFEDGERGGIDALLRLRGVGASKHRAKGSLEANYRFMINIRADAPKLIKALREALQDCEGLTEELREARSALRQVVIRPSPSTEGWVKCNWCEHDWQSGPIERHADDCEARPNP